MMTVSGQIALKDSETGPHQIEVIRPRRILVSDCTEKIENTRAIRRGKAAPRRMLRIEPLSVDLADGPVLVVLRSGDAAPRVLTHLDIPAADVARFRHLLQLELQDGIATKATYRRTARLEASFDKLPVLIGNADWLESWIILNCLRRNRPPRTHAMIGRLRDLRDAEGQPELLVSFLAMLTDDHGLDLPNGHAYCASLGQLDRPAIWQGITDIMTMLKDMGLTVFLNSGTLLGAVREGDLLGHDDVIDLGVLITGNTQEEAAESWESCARGWMKPIWRLSKPGAVRRVRSNCRASKAFRLICSPPGSTIVARCSSIRTRVES